MWGMITDAKNLADASGPGAHFFLRMAVALVRAQKERERILAVLECDFLSDDGPSAVVEMDREV